MSKAGSKGMAGMVMAIPIFVYSTGTSQSHFQGACNIHACSDLVELYAHLLVLESRATIVLLAFSLNDYGMISSGNAGTQEPICTHLCAFMKVFAAVPAHNRYIALMSRPV